MGCVSAERPWAAVVLWLEPGTENGPRPSVVTPWRIEGLLSLHVQGRRRQFAGAGIHVEVYEHDTWTSSGRHERWWLKCHQCESRYMRHRLYDYLVTRDDAKYAERRGTEIYAKRKAVGEKAAERYLTRYRDHIKALKFKMAMHSAIGGYGGISRIPQRADTEEKLHGVIENSIRSNPARALNLVHVEDPEIAA